MMETNERGIAKFLILCAVAFVFILVYIGVQILIAANSSDNQISNNSGNSTNSEVEIYDPKLIYYDDLKTSTDVGSNSGSLSGAVITQINSTTVREVFTRPSFSAVDENFSKSFKLCSPAQQQVSTDIGSVMYQVIGEGFLGCDVKVRFVEIIDASWNDLEMICTVNTYEDFTTVVGQIGDAVFIRGSQAVCFGGLYQRLVAL